MGFPLFPTSPQSRKSLFPSSPSLLAHCLLPKGSPAEITLVAVFLNRHLAPLKYVKTYWGARPQPRWHPPRPSTSSQFRSRDGSPGRRKSAPASLSLPRKFVRRRAAREEKEKARPRKKRYTFQREKKRKDFPSLAWRKNCAIRAYSSRRQCSTNAQYCMHSRR